MLSHILHGDDPLTDNEAVGLSLVFVLAGLDTVTATIGTTMLELARRPALRASLIAEPRQRRGIRRGDDPAGTGGARSSDVSRPSP